MFTRDENGFLGFIDAPGGTGKTFLLNAILNRIRGEGHIVLASAYSGVAALLLKGGTIYSFLFVISIIYDFNQVGGSKK